MTIGSNARPAVEFRRGLTLFEPGGVARRSPSVIELRQGVRIIEKSKP
jgi:hypothetical protein